ncbi:MAG: sulfotransferase [Pseudodonghicola sp.]
MDERLRIINLGLPKSGTTTLGVALGKAGLRVADWRIRKGQTEDRRILFGFVGDHLYRGYYETGDPLALLDDFDAVTEMSVASHGQSLWPQMDWGLLAAIRQHHPNTKFLLSHRDPAALVKSMLGWSNLGKSRLPQQNIPGLPAGYGATPEQLTRWIEGHYAFCRRVFRDDPDFLEYDLTDPEAPTRIGAFLGIDLPWWGRANAKDRDAEEAETEAMTRTVAAPAVARGATAPRRVYLHAGAHRTGTSSLQLCLAENRELLEGRGYALAYPARDGAPEGRLKLKLPEPRHEGADIDRLTDRAAREIDQIAGARDRLILSEENVPGRMMHFYSGRFFPAAETRAQALAQALGGPVGGPVAHLVYVLRAYDGFFVSAHRKRAVQRSVPDFASFRAQLRGLDRGWPELIALLQSHLRPERFTVIDYGQRGQSRDLLARLLPDVAAAELREPAQVLNLSATDRALEAIQARFAAEPRLAQAEIDRLIAAHAEDRADLGFASFPETERRDWRDRYAADLDRIAAMPDIALVRA